MQLHLLHRESRKIAEAGQLGLTWRRPHLWRDRAEHPEAHAVRRDQRRAKIRPDGSLRDQRVIGEPAVLLSIADEERLPGVHAMRTKRDIPPRFLPVYAMDRFEPLPRLVDQTDGRDRRAHYERRQARDPVELRFVRSVDDFVVRQRRQPKRLMRRVGCCGHCKPRGSANMLLPGSCGKVNVAERLAGK
jgi:hypothetical protein